MSLMRSQHWHLRFGGRPVCIIHELGAVILSGASAKNFRPASFAGRAGAESKDPYSGRIAQCSPHGIATNWRFHAVKGIPRLLVRRGGLVARDDTPNHLRSSIIQARRLAGLRVVQETESREPLPYCVRRSRILAAIV